MTHVFFHVMLGVLRAKTWLATENQFERVILSAAKNLKGARSVRCLPQILRCAQNDMQGTLFHSYLIKRNTMMEIGKQGVKR